MTPTLVRTGDHGCPGRGQWRKYCHSTISPQLPPVLPRPAAPQLAGPPPSPLQSPLPQYLRVQDPAVHSVPCAHASCSRDTAFGDTPCHHSTAHPTPHGTLHPAGLRAVASRRPGQGCAWPGLRGRRLSGCFPGACFTSRKCRLAPHGFSALGCCCHDSPSRKLLATPKLPWHLWPAQPCLHPWLALPVPHVGARPTGCHPRRDVPESLGSPRLWGLPHQVGALRPWWGSPACGEGPQAMAGSPGCGSVPRPWGPPHHSEVSQAVVRVPRLWWCPHHIGGLQAVGAEP